MSKLQGGDGTTSSGCAEIIEQRLTTLLRWSLYAKKCGQNGTSYCANPVAVRWLGGSDTFAIFFIGERLNGKVQLSLETDQLTEFDSEQYKNSTKDILAATSDIAYTNVDMLRIYTGKQGIVANIRGTSAATFIESQNVGKRVPACHLSSHYSNLSVVPTSTPEGLSSDLEVFGCNKMSFLFYL